MKPLLILILATFTIWATEYRDKYDSAPGEVLLSDFSEPLATGGWVLSGAGTAAKSTIVKYSKQSIKATCGSGTGYLTLRKILKTATDFTNLKFSYLTLYCPDRKRISNLTIKYETVTGVSNYSITPAFQYYLDSANGWYTIAFSKGKMSVGAGTPSWSSIVSIVVMVNTASGDSCSIYLDKWTVRPNPLTKAHVILTFDDSKKDVYINALPLMQAAKYKGVFNVSATLVGGATGLPWDSIRSLDTLGWDITNHTYNHAHLGSIGADSIKYELLKNAAIIKSRGIRYKPFLALPWGETSPSAESTIVKYVEFSRFTGGFPEIYETAPFAVPHALKAQLIWSTTTTTNIHQWVDSAVAKKSPLIFYLHGVGDTAGSAYSTTTEMFDSLINYLKSKETLGLLEVNTMSEYLELIKELNPHFNQRDFIQHCNRVINKYGHNDTLPRGDTCYLLKDFIPLAKYNYYIKTSPWVGTRTDTCNIQVIVKCKDSYGNLMARNVTDSIIVSLGGNIPLNFNFSNSNYVGNVGAKFDVMLKYVDWGSSLPLIGPQAANSTDYIDLYGMCPVNYRKKQ
jgi:peptidoglycan/xylan/chitin deacetylase (PgdA/CDA1 family)